MFSFSDAQFCDRAIALHPPRDPKRHDINFNIRLEDDRLCTLVMIGVRPDGTKERVAVEDGYRESTDSWATVLRDLQRRGMRAF